MTRDEVDKITLALLWVNDAPIEEAFISRALNGGMGPENTHTLLLAVFSRLLQKKTLGSGLPPGCVIEAESRAYLTDDDIFSVEQFAVRLVWPMGVRVDTIVVDAPDVMKGIRCTRA